MASKIAAIVNELLYTGTPIPVIVSRMDMLLLASH